MATTLKALARGEFGTSSGTIYTVPSATTSVVTNISICNTTANPVTFTLFFDSVDMFNAAVVAANTTAVIDLKQVLSATKIISGLASVSGIKYHISGAEIV